jgi:hypothetical protein
MSSKQAVFEFLNDAIEEEMGQRIDMDSLILDAGLDSLGLSVFFLTVDARYPIYKDVPEGKEYEAIGLKTLTMKELVRKCVLSTSATDTELN